MDAASFRDDFDAALAARTPQAFTALHKYVDGLIAHGRFGRHVTQVEESLARLVDCYGVDAVQTICEEFVLWCNSAAMVALSQGESSETLDLLTLADHHTTPGTSHLADDDKRKRLRGITLNNFACYFKRHGKLHTAIQYLEKTLKLEASISNVENPAGTHLNICAILSQMGRHARAAEHAQCAIELLKFERTKAKGELLMEKSSDSILAMAYYNWGVELEHMRRYDQAIKAFTRGHEVACNELENNHPMIQAIYKALIEVEDRVAIKKGYSITPRASPR
ncbi:unnamed protein product [Aphanomyces euteiches]